MLQFATSKETHWSGKKHYPNKNVDFLPPSLKILFQSILTSRKERLVAPKHLREEKGKGYTTMSKKRKTHKASAFNINFSRSKDKQVFYDHFAKRTVVH